MFRGVRLALAGLGGLVGCGTEPAPTFHADVLPIFAERCLGCHTEGGIGGFPLDDYATASQWAPAVKTAVQARTMPPWLATGDGSCGTFAQSEWLSDAEITTLSAWADGGAIEGDPDDSVGVEPAARPTLSGDVQLLSLPEFDPEIVGGIFAQYDEYRCFEVTNPWDHEVFVTGYDVHPDNVAIVHHVIGSFVDPERTSWSGAPNREVMDALAAEDDRDGWPCFSGAGDGVREDSSPINWAPGQGAVRLPEGVGVKLQPGHSVVLQVHYNLSNIEDRGTDASQVELQVAETVEREGWFLLPDEFLGTMFAGSPTTIPPGEASWKFKYDIRSEDPLRAGGYRWSDTDAYEILGVLPHMHERGVTMRVNRRLGGERECVVDVANWNFNWQRIYIYEEPIVVTEGQDLQVICTWDTTGESNPVLPGWGTRNEMCLAGLFVALPLP